MLNRLLRATVFASSLLLAGGAFVAPALVGDVYNRGNSADPESLDPHKTSTVYEAHILRDLFEGLVMQDQNAETHPGRGGKLDRFGRRHGLHLQAARRRGLVGRQPRHRRRLRLRLPRLQDPATGAEYASMLYVVKNGEEVNTGKMKPEELAVKAIDPMTFEVTLKSPTPYFLEMLTHQSTYPVNKADREARRRLDQGRQPRLERRLHAGRIRAQRPHQAGQEPEIPRRGNVKIDVVNYFPTEDRSTAVKRFEAGELDSNDDIPTEQLADLKAKFGDQLRIGPYLGTYYYAIKTDKAPWDNVELRNAISMAIDRDFLAEKVWQNSMLPGYSMVPPGIEGYTSAIADFADMSQIDREDEAKKILEKLGYTPDKPLKMEIRYNTSENHKNTAVAIQEQLKPLGVEVTLLNTDTKTHYGFLEQKGDFDVARAGWIADYKDPESFLGISREASRQQLLRLSTTEVRGGDGAGGGRRRQAGRAHEAPGRGRARAGRRGRQHPAPLLQLQEPRLAQDQGLRRERHGRHPTRFISKD